MAGRPALPPHHSEIDAAWLTGALRAAGLDVTVASVRRGSLGEGAGLMSGLARLELEYASGDGPPVLILKHPADNAANRAVADTFHLYAREVLFYRDVADRCSARTPHVYYAEIDGSDFVLLVEDLSAYRIGDQIVGATLAEAQATMRWMGRLHATFWGRVDDPSLEFLPMVHPSYSSEGLMQGAAYGWGPMVANFEGVVPAHIAALEDRFLAALPAVFERMATPPLTVLHGDVRMDNLFFGDAAGQEPLIAVDWQGALRGRAAQDLGYFMSGNVPVAVRRTHERDLIALWHSELCASGVTGYTAEDAWRDYRNGMLFTWTHAVVIAGTLDHANERGRAYVTEMLRRATAAFDDLDLASLL
jgi:Ecdysteroid kinase-like family